MRIGIVSGLVCAAVSVVGAAPAEAGYKRTKAAIPAAVERDCTPINGRFGYYGNPWCDTGSYRQEDIDFRQRNSHLRKLKGAAAK